MNCPKCNSLSVEFKVQTLIDGLTYLKERVLHCLICKLTVSETMLKNKRNPPAAPNTRAYRFNKITAKERETLKNL